MEDENELDFVAAEHDQLISAISKLDKTQHINEPTRNEPTHLISEFNLIKKSNKINLNNVVKVLKDTAYHVKLGQKLQNSQKSAKVLQKPLEKPQAERVKRATGYEQTKTKIGRWDPVVARNRTVDYVSFPINHTSSKLQSTDEFLSKLKIKSSLEEELDKIDPPIPEVESEEESTYPMSYEEMLGHRQNLAKIRAQQSYIAAKAKRQSKIKSKKYHRILKKEKMKKQLKEFEELQIKNPEEALKKLEEIERARALERHTLRHKNTGKWAKSKLVQAKYNKEVREQLAEQLFVSKSLTQKVQKIDSTDDEDNNGELITDTTLVQDPMNTWMMESAGKRNIDTEFDFGYKKYLKDKMFKRKTDSDSDSDNENPADMETNEEAAISFNALNKSIKKLSSLDRDKVRNENPKKVRNVQKSSNQKKIKTIQVTYTSSWLVDDTISSNKVTDKDKNINDINTAFEKFESNLVNKVENKLKMLKKQLDKPNSSSNNKKVKDVKKGFDNLEYLKLKKKEKAVIDEELIETYSNVSKNLINKEKNIIKSINQPIETNTQENNIEVNPSKLLDVKPRFLNSTLPNNVNDLDDLDDEEQVVPKVDIEKVFEEDDIVASFRQEKQDEINKGKEQEVVTTLPGWGSWGGIGVKAPKRKTNRFISKLPPKMTRRDENKGDIIINEYKDPKLAIHKVSELPFPFTSVKDYEASIRAPLGNTFIPEKAHKKLIRPSVITKAGAIIEPIDEESLLVKRNQTFKNQNIIKLLAKK